MENKKWFPCICTIVLGALVIAFTWWQVSWGKTALTVVGSLVILKGIIGRCCCAPKSLSSCCSDDEMKKEGGCCS